METIEIDIFLLVGLRIESVWPGVADTYKDESQHPWVLQYDDRHEYCERR